MSSELGVAVWGLGRHAHRRVLPALAESKSVRIVGICTRNAERGRAEAARYACRYFPSPEAMLGDRQVRAVYVVTPTGFHFTHAQQVLEADKHLWCEKPLTHSQATTCRLFDLAQQKGLMIATALTYKYHPQFALVKRVIADGTLGEIKHLSIRFGMPHLESKTFRDDPEAGGGALLDLGCYALSVAYQLLRQPVELVAAHLAATPPSRVDTEGWAVLRNADVGFDAAWGMGLAYRNVLEVWGSRGILTADRIFTKESDYDSAVQISNERGAQPTLVPAGRANGHVAMIDAFASSVGVAPFFSAERGEAEWCAAVTDRIASYRDGGTAPPK